MIRLLDFLSGAVGAAILATGVMAGGAVMAQGELPVFASAGFLTAVGKDGNWLDAQMEGTDFERVSLRVSLNTPDARQRFNRIRTFAELAQGARPAPFARIVLKDGSGALQSCVTGYAGNLLPDITVEDYARESFDVAGLDPKIRSILNCLPAAEAKLADLPLEFKLAFEDDGMLKPDFRDLQEDQTFLHALWNAGLYMAPESFSGMLKIE